MLKCPVGLLGARSFRFWQSCGKLLANKAPLSKKSLCACARNVCYARVCKELHEKAIIGPPFCVKWRLLSIRMRKALLRF